MSTLADLTSRTETDKFLDKHEINTLKLEQKLLKSEATEEDLRIAIAMLKTDNALFRLMDKASSL